MIIKTVIEIFMHRTPNKIAGETFADTGIDSPFDDVLKGFIYNVSDVIKKNIQDDGVCFVVIPPGELKLVLTGGNAGGPITFTDIADQQKVPSNNNFIFALAIIR